MMNMHMDIIMMKDIKDFFIRIYSVFYFVFLSLPYCYSICFRVYIFTG